MTRTPSRLPAAAAAIVALAGLLAACASVPPPPPPAPAPPPPGAGGGGAVLPDWRGVITAYDRDRLARLPAAWDLALQQARRRPGAGDLASLGALLDPDAGTADAAPPPGEYRCRTVKLGSQGSAGPGYVVYDWFACRVERTRQGLKLSKLTGSQRPAGLLFPEDADTMILLGSVALGDEPPATSYGQTPDRDVVGVLERIGPGRWRLALPWPQAESNLDLIELVATR